MRGRANFVPLVAAIACGPSVNERTTAPASDEDTSTVAPPFTSGPGEPSAPETTVDTGTIAPPGCASGTEWTEGNHGSPEMHPGVDCISCHQSGEGPDFTLAGTVMGALRDLDDCYGAAGVTVRITGADGDTFELVTNEAGNFYTDRPVATPYRAEVEKDGIVRAMSGEQTDGSCNSCHTSGGAYAAPGRILAPR